MKCEMSACCELVFAVLVSPAIHTCVISVLSGGYYNIRVCKACMFIFLKFAG